jgi:positive regulator of sigma E activity
MDKKGVVDSIGEQSVVIRVYPDEGCSHCGLCDARQDLLLKKERLPAGLRPGDAVWVRTSVSFYRVIALLYGLPLLFLIAGYIAGQLLFPGRGEWPGISGAVLGFAFSLQVVRIRGHRLDSKENIQILPFDESYCGGKGEFG